MPFPYSSAVVAGTDATADEYNNVRKDTYTRWFKFEVNGPLFVGNKQGGSFILPNGGTVLKILHKTTSGGATIRINAGAAGTTAVDSSISSSSSAAAETTISTPAVAANDLLTVDITAISSGVDLVVEVEILFTP